VSGPRPECDVLTVGAVAFLALRTTLSLIMGGTRSSFITIARVREAVGSPTFLNWTKTLTRFLSLEAVVQALTFACGILIVRALPKADYALFTVANTMQATMNLMADNGIGTGLIAIGGRVWQDRYRFGQLVATAMQLRRWFAVISVTLVTPLLFWMLMKNGASISYSGLITAFVLLGFYFTLTVGVLIPVPRLHLEVNRIQSLNILSSALRLTLLVIAYGYFLNTAVAMLAAALASRCSRNSRVSTSPRMSGTSPARMNTSP